MRFNQYSYTKVDQTTMLTELASLGFTYQDELSDKENFRSFLTFVFFQQSNCDLYFHKLLADDKTDLLTFFESEQALTAEIFYTVAFQVLGFVPGIDFEEVEVFRQESNFPVHFGDLLENLYQLLNCRTKSGNTLVDSLVSDGLIPEDNIYHYFNGKSLATFSSHDAIREVVYVESRVDTDLDGKPDLVKVSIIRPRFAGKIPAVMTASPYHQGVNDKASDKALQNMNVDLLKKDPHVIELTEPQLTTIEPQGQAELTQESTEKLGHISTYTLNDYLLPRGFANLYVSGVGTLDSEGLMTNGNYQQVEAYKNVIDWLNGRCRAFTDSSRRYEIKATWANGKVATTGLSYLGTMSNGLATTGVEGLEVIIAEAGISSWYNYYRENGLVTSPGGYPGEDFDSLCELTYSRNLRAGDALRHNAAYQDHLAQLRKDLDRDSGDYNQFWQDRNYLLKANQVKAEVVFTHGTQDWNVKPGHVYQMFHSLPKTIHKHLFLHQGAHVYMNNWQSIDFRESMNALLSQKLLGYSSDFSLPTVIWQDNSAEQSWKNLENFGSQEREILPLGQGEAVIDNQYKKEDYERYGKNYRTFLGDLYEDKAQAASIDLTLEQDLLVNGPMTLKLRLKSSTDKGLLSAQVLHKGFEKGFSPYPSPRSSRSMDNGRYYIQENLMELPFAPAPNRVVTKGYLNLQNRSDLLTVEDVIPNEWMEFSFQLQPTIYQMKKGTTLRILLYTTDFEITVRDQTDYQLTVDLEQSHLEIPIG